MFTLDYSNVNKIELVLNGFYWRIRCCCVFIMSILFSIMTMATQPFTFQRFLPLINNRFNFGHSILKDIKNYSAFICKVYFLNQCLHFLHSQTTSQQVEGPIYNAMKIHKFTLNVQYMFKILIDFIDTHS